MFAHRAEALDCDAGALELEGAILDRRFDTDFQSPKPMPPISDGKPSSVPNTQNPA
jgi:hypothetical protein